MSFQYNIFSNTMPDSDDPVANSYSHHDHHCHHNHDHLVPAAGSYLQI